MLSYFLKKQFSCYFQQNTKEDDFKAQYYKAARCLSHENPHILVVLFL